MRNQRFACPGRDSSCQQHLAVGTFVPSEKQDGLLEVDSDPLVRRRRDEWDEAGSVGALEGIASKGSPGNPTTGPSGSSSLRWSWTAASPRHRAATRRREGAQWTGENGNMKRSEGVEARNVPLGVVSAPANRVPANRYDSLFLGLDPRRRGGSDAAARRSEFLTRPRLRLRGL
jgi:hypothetical protein